MDFKFSEELLDYLSSDSDDLDELENVNKEFLHAKKLEEVKQEASQYFFDFLLQETGEEDLVKAWEKFKEMKVL